MWDFVVALLKVILPGLLVLFGVSFLIFLILLPTIAAWRSKYLISIDEKLDRLLLLFGDDQNDEDE